MGQEACLERFVLFNLRPQQLNLTHVALLIAFFAFPVAFARAQDRPYFVTYSHDLQETGQIEIESKAAISGPDQENQFGAIASEVEYGVRNWWTSGLYLDEQSTGEESTLFTGFRFENRLRPLKGEHAINPVFYIEFEDISGADKTCLEVVGHDTQSYLEIPNGISRRERKHEGELKLILSSNIGAWNVAENLTAEKNLGHAPWEFGYAVGVTRPLRAASADHPCVFCAQALVAGMEAYGGLGDTAALGLNETSHYLSALVGWQLHKGVQLNVSPGFGLEANSLDRIYRVGFAYDVPRTWSAFRKPRAQW
jgi:hypothetical protein